jgi:hypothetical protein
VAAPGKAKVVSRWKHVSVYHPLRQSSGARVTGIVLRLVRLATGNVRRPKLATFDSASAQFLPVPRWTDPDGSITCCNHLNRVCTCVPNFDYILELILSN